MSTPLPLPLRILVKGPSTVLWTSMMGGSRSDLAFPRAMEQRLLAGGRPVQVLNCGLLGWETRELFTHWDEEIVAWSPDIVILAVGHYETLHAFLPRWLERGANTVNRRPSLFSHFYYRRILRLAARGVLLIQKAVDRPGIKLKRRMRRVVADTDAYIQMSQQVGSPLFLLMEIHPPSASKRDWFGGWTDRIHALNDDLRQLAESPGRSNVRFVEITDLMQRFDPGDAEHLWADGIHFSPDFHRAIGGKFAEIAEEWAAGQPHLAHP